MKLETLQLENIRSHVKTVIEFTNGFNCLVGGLGQGKSTVLYAFDFVLFGDPIGRSYDYLLREDAEQGSVTAVFVHNGETYKLHRALKRQEKGISQDIDQLRFYRDGKLIASNKNEAVAEQLKALTGLDKNLFREVVWVRQEHLKELIDITPRQRQKKLDQLFGLSDYEAAWGNMQMFQKTYETEKKVLDRDIDVIRIKKLDEDYTKAVEDFSNLDTQFESAVQKLAQTEKQLELATACLEGLEELREITENLQRREIELKTNLANTQRRHKELEYQQETNKRRLGEQEKSLEQLQEQQQIHRNALTKAGFGADQTLEQIRKHLREVDEQLRKFGGEQEATRREMNASENKIASIVSENKCPRCLQEVSGEYKQSLQEALQKEQKESKKRIAELQTKIDELKTEYTAVSGAVSNLQQIVPRINDLQKQVNEKQELLTTIVSQIHDATVEEKRLQKQLEETREEISKFDVSELESARENRQTAFRDNLNAKNAVQTLEQRKQDLSIRVDELKERLDYAQSKVERKEKIGKLLEVIDRIRVAYRSIQPKLRSEFVNYLERTVQQVLDSLVGDVGPSLIVNIDETYSPFVSSDQGYEREVENLSGGERTLLAFAYRIGLGQLIMQSRSGHGLFMLLLDEPTESLGREDGSVERLADAISRFKAIEQIIAVTHNEAFAEKAEHVIRIEKHAGASQVFIEQ
ncbi:MAG: SMC family ATPase [Candidatus Bathyarchaeota archaeon]|nr:SMC family ATPase [Candidatus Bathyarchaeota archaeon]